MAIIRMTSAEIDEVLTPERIATELKAAKDMPFIYDEDCPELTESQLAKLHRVNTIKMPA